MTSRPALFDRYARTVVSYRRQVILIILLLTVVIGAGVIFLDGEVEMVQFEVTSEEQEAMDYIESNFHDVDHAVTIIVLSDEAVFSAESIDESMGLQETLRANETVAGTMADGHSTIGVGNVIAYATDDSLVDEQYTIADEREAIADLTEEELHTNLEEGIELDDVVPGDRPSARTLLPADADGDIGDSNARLVLVIHDESVADEELLAAQTAIDSIVSSEVTETNAFVFGEELTFDRGATATAESFGFVGPLVVILVFLIMLLAYRNLVDVVLSLGGILLVLLWVGGFLGWSGIGMNQLMVAVPCLLVGLSIDHGFHLFFREREAFRFMQDSERAIGMAIAGVVGAISMTTFTTVFGFLSGVFSPIWILQAFGVVAAFGIIAAFVIFAAFLPAIKTELALTYPGLFPYQNARNSSSVGLIRRPLRTVTRFVQRIPVGIIFVALLLFSGGIVGLSTVDTTAERTDFLPGDTPNWIDSLPADIGPEEYTLRDEAKFIDDTFDRERDDSVSILLRGDPTDPMIIESIANAEARAIESPILGERSDGRAVIHSPLTVIESLALHHPEVAETLEAADTTGDQLPDTDIEDVLDAAFVADTQQMGEVVHRNDDGEYESIRVVITVDNEVAGPTVQREMAAVADQSATGDIDAVATGAPILEENQSRAVLFTTFGTFGIALLVIVLVLILVTHFVHGSWLLGAMTVTPVIFALSWLLLVMGLFSIPLNAESAIIAGIAIGIGVDYAIHIMERYMQERKKDADAAMERTIVETGGTLVLSATTTMVGFGILLLTFVPSLQRFGFLTALFVGLVLFGSIVVLPALLTVWERRINPSKHDE